VTLADTQAETRMDTVCDYSKLSVPNDEGYVAIATRYVGSVAEKLGFEASECAMVERAVAEVLTDIITYAFDPNDRSTLEVSCERIPLGLKVVVRDWGMPFEPRLVTADAVEEESGLVPRPESGLAVLKKCVNEVEFHNLGPEGKETVLVKYLKHRTITDYYDACELGPYATSVPEGRSPASPSDIVVRRMQPEEAVEVAKCVYKAYGYSYGNEHVYFPERLTELNRAGEVFSAVAVTGNHEVAGHAALIRYDKDCPIAEMGMAVVQPAFRGLGLLTRLTEFIVAQARAEGLTGVFSQAVTNHPYSQQAGLHIGEKDCAVKVGFVPATSTFKGITERLPQRDSAVLHFMYLNKPSTVQICVPPHHRDMILSLYHNLGISPELVEIDHCSEQLQPDESVVRVGATVRMGLAHIDVEQYGRNVVREVHARLQDLCRKHFEVIHLHLNLNFPSTCRLTEQFEELGFFFSGILPTGCTGDHLILQYLNNVAIDYGKIVIKSEMGQALLAYIRQRDPNA
jgi:anti-sigma regulatory factor (Ser/Thr protein kinase)/N-acetylglutamate synthase-like GNAT family acetyltransferase